VQRGIVGRVWFTAARQRESTCLSPTDVGAATGCSPGKSLILNEGRRPPPRPPASLSPVDYGSLRCEVLLISRRIVLAADDVGVLAAGA